ncbi:MAG TPA: FAD-dependent thymidylate synthase, partial [Nitrososphaera sp.]|nr:FAD-dependent thymidylate synthase [Nitrososphaera sp.]
LPLHSVRDRISAWPLNRKLAVFEAYLGDEYPGSALEKAHYSWDLLCPYSVFRELQKLPSEALVAQTLTPRYGYDIPQLVEEADLADLFEKCFDLSLELYSDLQRAGHQTEAQYATLYGHNQRWQMTQNARQAIMLHKASELNADSLAFTKQMAQKLAESHPIIGEIANS